MFLPTAVGNSQATGTAVLIAVESWTLIDHKQCGFAVIFHHFFC